MDLFIQQYKILSSSPDSVILTIAFVNMRQIQCVVCLRERVRKREGALLDVRELCVWRGGWGGVYNRKILLL